jgi:hypothetical protein
MASKNRIIYRFTRCLDSKAFTRTVRKGCLRRPIPNLASKAHSQPMEPRFSPVQRKIPRLLRRITII